jgi:DUF971 family protein
MNLELLTALLKWQRTGSRSVDIRIDDLASETIYIWAYDYDLALGKRVKEVSDIPTVKELVDARKKELREELETLS